MLSVALIDPSMTNIASKRLLSDTFKSIYVPIVSSASSTLDIQAGIKLKLIPSSPSSISRRRSLALHAGIYGTLRSRWYNPVRSLISFGLICRLIVYRVLLDLQYTMLNSVV